MRTRGALVFVVLFASCPAFAAGPAGERTLREIRAIARGQSVENAIPVVRGAALGDGGTSVCHAVTGRGVPRGTVMLTNLPFRGIADPLRPAQFAGRVEQALLLEWAGGPRFRGIGIAGNGELGLLLSRVDGVAWNASDDLLRPFANARSVESWGAITDRMKRGIRVSPTSRNYLPVIQNDTPNFILTKNGRAVIIDPEQFVVWNNVDQGTMTEFRARIDARMAGTAQKLDQLARENALLREAMKDAGLMKTRAWYNPMRYRVFNNRFTRFMGRSLGVVGRIGGAAKAADTTNTIALGATTLIYEMKVIKDRTRMLQRLADPTLSDGVDIDEHLKTPFAAGMQRNLEPLWEGIQRGPSTVDFVGFLP